MFAVHLVGAERHLVGRFHESRGLEGGDGVSTCTFRFQGGRVLPASLSAIGQHAQDFDVDICDNEGETIATYSTGMLAFEWCRRGNTDVLTLISASPRCLMRTGSLRLWRERRAGLPSELGSWIPLDRAMRAAWLEVCLKDRRRFTDPFPGPIALNGELVRDSVSFFCALGEAVYGPAGYIGGSCGSMQDCLTAGITGPSPLRELHWEHSKVSEASFQGGEGLGPYSDILDVLAECRVRVLMR